MTAPISGATRISGEHRRALGPVTLAIRTMRAAHDDRAELQALSNAIAARIAADRALLETLGR